MNWLEGQTAVHISGTVFPKFEESNGKTTERFWHVKEEFVRHSQSILNYGKMFSHISGQLIGNRWVCSGKPIASSDVAEFVWKLRLFYLKSEPMSIFSFCTYMEKHDTNNQVRKFFTHMRESWEVFLTKDSIFFGENYLGFIKTNRGFCIGPQKRAPS